MADRSLQISKDFRLSGLKFSNELVLFSFLCEDACDNDYFASLLAKIAARRVNLPFIRYSTPRSCQFCFCVESADEAIILQLFTQNPHPDVVINNLQQVGIITIFPHRGSYRFIAAILAILSDHQLPIYCMGTSVSNLSIATDFSRLDELATAIQRHFPLPENHAPFRPEMRIEQIFPETVIK